MSKSILVIDTPKNCGDCPFCIFTAEEKNYIGYCHTSDDDYYCKILDRFMRYDEVDGGYDILGKPKDCPLTEESREAIVKAEEGDKEIKTLEDLENYCKKNTGHGMNVPPFVYTDKYFKDIEKAYGNGYRAGYKEAYSDLCLMASKVDGGDAE